MQTTINIRKEESKPGNLSVELLCLTLDLPCGVKNVKGSASLPANYLDVVSTSPPPARERVAKTYKKLWEVDEKRCISF